MTTIARTSARLALSLLLLACADDPASSGPADDVATSDASVADGSAADVAGDVTEDTGQPMDAPEDAATEDAGPTDAGFDAGSEDAGGVDTMGPEDAAGTDTAAPDGGEPDSGGSDCSAEVQALQEVLYAKIGTCSVVVRLDHDSLAMLGYQVICGAYAAVDEATASATAQADTGYGQGISVLSPPNPEDAYVFYQPPGDFGGASAVNARNGLTVFGGSIIWLGAGDITYPTTWLPAVELGAGCPAVGGDVAAVGYDLVSGTALGDDDVAAALAVVADTAVPAAIWGGGYLFDAVVLRYPRSVGAFDPTTAEWIVIVNGGWLE